MTPASSADDQPSALVRTANVLVVIALMTMLVGAVVLLLARDQGVVDLDEGQEAVVYDRSTPQRVLGAESFELQISANGTTEVTVSMEETTTGSVEENTTVLAPGERLVWEKSSDPGEHWRVTVQNGGPAFARVAVSVTSEGNLWIGGALVAFGAFGFVFHRIGMRKG